MQSIASIDVPIDTPIYFLMIADLPAIPSFLFEMPIL